MKYFHLSLLLVTLLVPAAASAQNPFGNKGLYIKPGTFTVTGTVSAEYINVTPEGGDSTSGMFLTFAPSLGYFVSENVSILVSMAATVPTGDLFDNLSTSWLIAAGAVYYHRINDFYIYAGLLAGYIKPGDSTAEASTTMKNTKALGDLTSSLQSESSQTAIIVPAGLLFPITSSLAFDVGLRVFYVIDEDDNAYLDVALGWFGLQAFF